MPTQPAEGARLQPCLHSHEARGALAAEVSSANLRGKATRLLLLLTLLLTPALSLHAQGCTQCLDSTRATPAPVQAAYRHAIELLGGAAVGIFITGTLLLRSKR